MQESNLVVYYTLIIKKFYFNEYFLIFKFILKSNVKSICMLMSYKTILFFVLFNFNKVETLILNIFSDILRQIVIKKQRFLCPNIFLMFIKIFFKFSFHAMI